MKGQTAIFEEMIEDEEGLVDDRLPTTSRGLWAASETERTLKAILSFAKAKRLDPELVEEGNTFMELFENWKKEYKVFIYKKYKSFNCDCDYIFKTFCMFLFLRFFIVIFSYTFHIFTTFQTFFTILFFLNFIFILKV